MKTEILEKIAEICTSDKLHNRKIDEIYEIVIKVLEKDKKIPDNQKLLKMGRKIIKEKNLSISKLKLDKYGDFEFLVYYSAGCNGDWWDKEVLSPFMFHEKVVKPNL